MSPPWCPSVIWYSHQHSCVGVTDEQYTETDVDGNSVLGEFSVRTMGNNCCRCAKALTFVYPYTDVIPPRKFFVVIGVALYKTKFAKTSTSMTLAKVSRVLLSRFSDALIYSDAFPFSNGLSCTTGKKGQRTTHTKSMYPRGLW